MPRAIDRGRAAGHYQDALRNIIHAFKYEGRRSLAKPLAALMHRQAGELLDGVDWIVPVPLHWRRERERGFNQASDLARSLIVGNNDGGASTRRPRLLHALRRVRHTTTQADLPAARRHGNVRDAFALSLGLNSTRLRRGENAALHLESSRETAAFPADPYGTRLRRGEDAARRAIDALWPSRQREWMMRALAGSCVLLVDDVSTTGATLDACARVLKEAARVREIRAVTAARVVTRPSR